MGWFNRNKKETKETPKVDPIVTKLQNKETPDLSNPNFGRDEEGKGWWGQTWDNMPIWKFSEGLIPGLTAIYDAQGQNFMPGGHPAYNLINEAAKRDVPAYGSPEYDLYLQGKSVEDAESDMDLDPITNQPKGGQTDWRVELTMTDRYGNKQVIPNPGQGLEVGSAAWEDALASINQYSQDNVYKAEQEKNRAHERALEEWRMKREGFKEMASNISNMWASRAPSFQYDLLGDDD